MENTLYKLYLINSKVIYIGICGDEDHILLKDFREIDKDGFFEWSCDEGETLFIPVRNILYIEAVDMD